MSYDWEILPEILEVHNTLMKQADLKARLKIAKLELEIYQAELMRLSPRNASVKLVGVDDESKARLGSLLQRIVDVECELDSVDALVKFNSHRIESAKMLAYKNRI